MWIWIVSLIVLIACFIFAWKMLVNNFDLMPNKKKLSMFRDYAPSEISYNQEMLRGIKTKLRTLEDQNAYYEMQFTKLQQRLNQLEETGASTTKGAGTKEDDEDWKEMYYEENEKKEKLENELDAAQQELETLHQQIASTKQNHSEYNTLKSDFENRMNEIQSFQNTIGELQRDIEAAGQREKDLEIQLQKEIRLRQQLEKSETIQTSLRSENEGLKRQITEMSLKQNEVEKKLMRLNELENKVSTYEEEKSKMIADLEMMINQTRAHNQ